MEEIYIRDVVRLLWRAKWCIVAATAIAVGLGARQYAAAIPQYEITMTLVPADSGQNPWDQRGQGAASIASQFLGASYGDQTRQKAQQFLALFRSPVVLERVDQQLGLLPHLYYANWDTNRKQWIEPSGWRTQVRTMLRADLPWVPPSLADASKLLERGMTVDEQNGGGVIAVTLIDRDPAFGKALMQALYRESDDVLRSRARAQNDEHIGYIQRSLSTVGYAETRQSLTTLLTAEVGQKIMINSDSPYAMDILEPPFADPRPVSPSLSTHMLVALVAGFIFGVLAFVVWTQLPRTRRSQQVATKTPTRLKEAGHAQHAAE